MGTLIEKDGYIYCEIRKSMYGLKEVGIISYQNLVKNLAPYGYEPTTYTPGFWCHKTRKTTFTLAVDNFGIKYFGPDDLEHLLTSLKNYYAIKVDLTGANYCGLKID